MPSSPSRQADLSALVARPFAHRGLHGGGRIENSRAAFEAAIEEGHGIELDVQASADGVAMVFHDYELERLTEAAGKVAELDAAALGRIALTDAHETIPTLAEILTLIGGRVPLLIEVKAPDHSVAGLCKSIEAPLTGYTGAVGVMSFNPEVGRWFAGHAPERLRGLVVTERNKGWRGPFERRFALWDSRADFLAYDVRDLPSGFAAKARAKGRPVLTWTVRTQDDRLRAAASADQIIYETFPR